MTVSEDPQLARLQGEQAAIDGFETVRRLPPHMQAWLDGYWVASLNMLEEHLARIQHP